MAIDPEPEASTPTTLFTDDVVSNNNDPSRIGVITRTALEDEESDDEYDDEEEPPHDEERIPPSHARVLWLPPDLWLPDHPAAAQAEQERADGFSSVVDVSTLSLVDRSLLHGDVVVRASDPLGQMGHVVDVSVELDLTLTASRSLTAIPSTRLSFVHPYHSGVYVTCNDGLWLGYVDDCSCDITLRFGDGSECTVASATGRDLRDPRHGENMMAADGSGSLFYPGQELTGRAAVWRQAEWHKGNKSSPARFNHTGVVSHVRPVRVIVQWVTGPDQYEDTATEVELSETQLRVLSCYEHARMMLGDRVMLSEELMKEKFGDEQEEAKSSTTEQKAPENQPAAEAEAESAQPAAAAGKKLNARDKRKLKRTRATQRRQESEQKDEGRRCALITRSRTSVSILWQNGVREDNIPSTALLPRTDLIDNDFMPTDYVLVRGSQRLATVLSVDATDRTCRVRWLDPIADDVTVPFPADENDADGGEAEADVNALGPRRAGEEAEVSIFDVVAHPRLELSLSSHVVRIPGAEEGNGESADVPFGTAGQIIDFQQGLLRVQWGDADSRVCVVQADQVWNVDQAEALDEEEEEEGYDEDEDYPVDEDGNPIELTGFEVGDDEGSGGGNEIGGGITGVLGSWLNAFTGGGGPAAGGARRPRRQGGATVEEIQSGEEEGEGEGDEEEDEEDEEGEEEDEEGDEDDEDEDDETESEQDGHEDDAERDEAERRLQQSYGRQTAYKRATARRPPEPTPAAAATAAAAVEATEAQPAASEPPAQSDAGSAEGTDQTVLGSTALYSLFFGNKAATAASADATSATAADDTAAEAADASKVDTAAETVDLQTLYAQPPTSAAAFASFTVLSNPATHYFISTPFPTAPPPSFIKKVRADLRLLRLHLPAGIHVLTYESRLDLLRAVIVGPRWTPFYSSLFLFDIHLPHNYPDVPPTVHYYSHGLRLHPNLYVEGKVFATPPHTISLRR